MAPSHGDINLEFIFMRMLLRDRSWLLGSSGITALQQAGNRLSLHCMTAHSRRGRFAAARVLWNTVRAYSAA
jgi:hypothetical protein